MAHDIHHEHLIKELAEQFEPLFSNSPQAIYVYLDDNHKFCNEKFADMLGYKSPKAWADYQYPVEDVLEQDKDKGIEAYMNASRKFIATTLSATWVRKDGKQVKTTVTMAPFSYKGEVFVIHYITPK